MTAPLLVTPAGLMEVPAAFTDGMMTRWLWAGGTYAIRLVVPAVAAMGRKFPLALTAAPKSAEFNVKSAIDNSLTDQVSFDPYIP